MMLWRTLALACAFATLSSFTSLASAQTTQPLDEIHLRDGTFLRGTIIERSATRVVVMLPTGEVREYPAREVLDAAPTPPPTVQVVEPVRESVRVHVSTDQSDLFLQRMTGTASVAVWTGRAQGTARLDAFSLVCAAPCEVDVEPGTYQLGVSRGNGTPIRAGRPVTLTGGDVHLSVGYTNNEPLRIAGWITWIGGALAGGLLAATASLTGPEVCSGIGRYCYNEFNMSQLIAGTVIAVLAMAVGIPLAFAGDGASVEETSGGRWRASRERLRPDALLVF